MPGTMVFVVGDDVEATEKLKNTLEAMGINMSSYSSDQWRDGMNNPFFRNQLMVGVPSLFTGSSPVENRGNVLPFPGTDLSQFDTSAAGRSQATSGVSTMDELESRAIENAIVQYRGNLTEAAKALGIGRATLYRKVKQYNIDPSFARNKKKAA